MADGLGRQADHAASSPGQDGWSASGGAPCERYSAGIRSWAVGMTVSV